MASVARWCFRHRRIVLALWLVALIGFGALDRAVGSSYANNFSLPATDSSRALDILKANFPSQAGDSEQIVVQAKNGTLNDPATKAEVTAMLAKVATAPPRASRHLPLRARRPDQQGRHHRPGHRLPRRPGPERAEGRGHQAHQHRQVGR